jgi:hypothetical protein
MNPPLAERSEGKCVAATFMALELVWDTSHTPAR